MYVSVCVCVFVCYRYTISSKTNARKRSEIGKMVVEVEYTKKADEKVGEGAIRVFSITWTERIR